MWIKSRNLLPKIVLLCFLVCCCFCSSVGYTQTNTAMTESITIPIQQWQTLKSELTALNSELIQYQQDLTKLKKPTQNLVDELNQAQQLQKKLQQELTDCKTDLTLLSKEAAESKTLLATLKQQITKERKIHKRQVWQNRFWCLLIGTGIGIVASR